MRRDQTRAPEPMRSTLPNTDQPRIPHSEHHYTRLGLCWSWISRSASDAMRLFLVHKRIYSIYVNIVYSLYIYMFYAVATGAGRRGRVTRALNAAEISGIPNSICLGGSIGVFRPENADCGGRRSRLYTDRCKIDYSYI